MLRQFGLLVCIGAAGLLWGMNAHAAPPAHSVPMKKAMMPLSNQTDTSKPQDTKPADKAEPKAATGKTDEVSPDIQAEALWDGRKMVPFHALDNPTMVEAGKADFLDDGEYVLGITINGQSRAYPTRFVWWHHFINDHTDKAGPDYPAYVITYCSVCNSGIRFDARVDGKPLLFDFYGLYNGVAIMCDRDTQSVWLQVEGRAIKGPRKGQQLHPTPLLDTTWAQWKRLHPDTLVMSPDGEYTRVYRSKDKPEPRGYDAFPAPFFAPTLTRGDKRLPRFEKVLAVRVPKNGKDALLPAEWLCRAYPVATLKANGSVVNDMLGDLPVAAFFDPESTTANAVSRMLDGKTLTFETRKDNDKPAIYDKETGTRWNIEGVGEAGPLAGKSLKRLDSHLSQWYGWVAYYPETSIFGRTDPPQTEKLTLPAANSAVEVPKPPIKNP